MREKEKERESKSKRGRERERMNRFSGGEYKSTSIRTSLQ